MSIKTVGPTLEQFVKLIARSGSSVGDESQEYAAVLADRLEEEGGDRATVWALRHYAGQDIAALAGLGESERGVFAHRPPVGKPKERSWAWEKAQEYGQTLADPVALVAAVAAAQKQAEAIALGKRVMRWAETFGELAPLYRSKRAGIVWGRGGQEDYDRPYGGKFKGWVARWKNAGVRIEADLDAILEDYLGREVARIALRDLPE